MPDCTCAGTAPGFPQHEWYCGRPAPEEIDCTCGHSVADHDDCACSHGNCDARPCSNPRCDCGNYTEGDLFDAAQDRYDGEEWRGHK